MRSSATSKDNRPQGDAAPLLEDVQLHFALNFISGKGLLTTRDLDVGPFRVKVLELEIPHIAFPFDVTGGADRFKTRRCQLRNLVLGLDVETLNKLLDRPGLLAAGFSDVRAGVREGFVELAGRFAIGEHQADFTTRASLLMRSPEEVAVVFYDTRVYGWLPVPAALLPVFLRRGLDLPFIGGERAGAWIMRPAEQFLRELMPRLGWKVPDISRAALAGAELGHGQLLVAVGPHGEPTPRQIAERQPPVAAVLAGEGIALFDGAEHALGRGEIQEAYEIYRAAIDDERASRFVRERLLQIGAADPELAIETRHLAEELLAKDREDVQAQLALAAIAMRERSWGEAANRYDVLGELARNRKERFDAVASELASAQAAAPIDVGAAIAAYERAAGRARDNVAAHRALLELRGARGEWDKAVKAGERLVRLEKDPIKRAHIHRELGGIYQRHTSDLRRARVHFERALRLAPDDPGVLEGLAETYAARGEPARAASYLARLAEQAEQSGDTARIVSLNLRLGEIWERWLGDTESASARYMRVLDVEPRHRTARLRLAELAEKAGDHARARAVYEELVSFEEDSANPEAVGDVVTAYTRLARIILATDGVTPEAISSLERAVELDPAHRAARDELGRVLRERGEWSKLAQLLEQAARASSSMEEARLARLDAAKLELHRRGDRQAAMHHLNEIVAVHPDDPEALDLLIPILQQDNDYVSLMERVAAAAEHTAEPMRRARYYLDLARARAALGTDPESRRRALEDALDANPYLVEAAEQLVQLLDDYDDHERLVRALSRLAVATDSPDVRADALLRQGRILWQDLRRPQEAEEALREAVRLEPGNFATWTALSRLLETIGKIDDATAALSRALEEAGRRGANKAPLHERMAELARARENVELEAEHLQLAIRAGLRNERISNRLVQVLSQLGRLHEAAMLLEEWGGEADTPEHELFLLKAAELRRSMGEMERASDLFRKLLSRRGNVALPAARALERIARDRGNREAVIDALDYQLVVAERDEQPALLERLLEAHADGPDFGALERHASRLLELETHSLAGHWHLARCLLRIENFHESLYHLERLLLDGPRGVEHEPLRREAYELAASLATEIDANVLVRIHEAYESELGDDSEALDRPYGELLAERGEWKQLLGLRKAQLGGAEGERRARFCREIADTLHHKLARSEEAIPFYQDAIAHAPNDLSSREALVLVLERLGRWGDLAQHLFAMSQLMSDYETSLEYGLRSVAVYAEQVRDQQAGRQVLSTLVSSWADVDPHNQRLVTVLRELDMYGELAHVLGRSLEDKPSVDDGRLAELVHLIEGPVGEPGNALSWAKRFVESDPDEDLPRELYADVLERNPELGDLYAFLAEWAAQREGIARAPVLIRLAEHLRAAKRDDESLRVLEQAADVDPRNAIVLQTLVDRHTARGAWPQALRWLEQLARNTDEPDGRDERWRRVVEVASDYVDDAEAAVRALRALSQRSQVEDRHLAQLMVETGDLDGMRELASVIEEISPEALMKAARALAEHGRYDDAKLMLDKAMARGQEREAWTLAEQLWRKHGRLGELARWRLTHAAVAQPEDADQLRLVAYVELLEVDELPERDQVAAALARANLEDAGAAWAAFRLGEAIDDPATRDRSSAVLERAIADDDPRLADILFARVKIALASGRGDDAAELAKRLTALDAERGEPLLDAALKMAGRNDELIAVLSERAARRDPHEAAELWLDVARLHADAREGLVALRKVDESERGATWAELAHQLAEAVDEPAVMAAAARVAADYAADDQARARWLRIAARLMWWRLEEPDRALELLADAQGLVPEDARAFLDRAAAAIGEEARRHLSEGLAILSAAEAVPLHLALADLAEAETDPVAAVAALEAASAAAPEDVSVALAVAERAERLGETELVLGARKTAMHLDEAHEDGYVAALLAAGRAGEAASVLEQRADDRRGPAAAQRYERAAAIVETDLGERPRASALWERAVRAEPRIDNLRRAFAFAVELGRVTAIPVFAEGLLKRLPEGEREERVAVTRAWIDALDSLGLEEETLPLRTALNELGVATAADRLVLSRLVGDQDPNRAADLLRDAARDPSNAGEPQLLLDAAAAMRRRGRDDEALELAGEAIARGLDTLASQGLVYELGTGERRLGALERVLELGGDEEWSPVERARARMELADRAVGAGDLETARARLVESAAISKLAGWTQAMEAVLQSLERHDELAALWVGEATADGTGWSALQRNDRLRRAVAHYEGKGDAANEYRALELLTELAPEDAAASDRLMAVTAELGDRDSFVRRVEEQLASASAAPARAQVVLRYADVLAERFGERERVVSLLEEALAEAPSRAVAEALQRHAADRGTALAGKLFVAAPRLSSPDDIAVLELSRAAAQGDDELSYAIERELKARAPDDATIAERLLVLAKRLARWSDVLELLRARAAASEARAAHGTWLEAAELARTHFQDAALEVELLESALRADPTDVASIERAFALRCAAKDVAAAHALIEMEGWSAEHELPALLQVAKLAQEAGDEARAAAIMDRLAARHPETPQAAEVRLQRARQAQDHALVRAEVERRLEHAKDLKPVEWLRLHQEAGEAALAAGDGEAALKHFIASIDTPDPEPEALRRALQVTLQLGDDDRMAFVVQQAANVRELITTRAISARGEERGEWLHLLGLAHEAASDPAAAVEAYRQAMPLSQSTRPFDALERLYKKRGEWSRLVELYKERTDRATTREEIASGHYQIGVLWKEYLVDEERAEQSFAAAVEANPGHTDAQLALGMLLHARSRYDKALVYLRGQVPARGAEASVEQWMALLDCLRQTNATDEALGTTDVILTREPARHELRAGRAELLEALGRAEEAEAEWQRYIDAIGRDGDPTLVAGVHQRLAKYALARGDGGAALLHWQAAYQLQPDSLEALTGMRALHEAAGRWTDAAALRSREIALTHDPSTQLEHHRALGVIYRDHLRDLAKAASHLERAHELARSDGALVRELVALFEQLGEQQKVLVYGERLIALTPEDDLDPRLLERMAAIYEKVAGDPARAKDVYGLAFKRTPDDAAIKIEYHRLALAMSDWAAFAPLEEDMIENITDPSLKADRLQRLAEIYTRELGYAAHGAELIAKARALKPDDAMMQRRLADTYALDPATYAQAAELYRGLLAAEPLNRDLLRILARLAGQSGDTDRAYGYYAALLVLTPSDAEAKRFVAACRGAMPQGPQRVLTDADRTQGLIHPDQSGPLEELFAPLARFAELTHPGNLRQRGVEERDLLAPTDERVKWLLRVIEPMGLPQSALYLWRGGGFACEAELLATPAILLGSTLASDASHRQRAFLVARTVELYRSGHTLCDRLAPADLEALTAAIALALMPGTTPPGSGQHTAAWAQIIAAPMTDQIRNALGARAQAYVKRFAELDVGAWRRGCMSTAARVALLVSCDIEDAITAMLRLRGFDDVSDEQRPDVLRESPESIDLFRFALSDAYFKLRESVGMALRRSK